MHLSLLHRDNLPTASSPWHCGSVAVINNCATAPWLLSLQTSEGDLLRHNNNCANAPRPLPLSSLRRELSKTQQQLRQCATNFISLHASEGASCANAPRPLPPSTELFYEQSLSPRFGGSTYTTIASSTLILLVPLRFSRPVFPDRFTKTRLILGGTSLCSPFTTRLTALQISVTTTGHHRLCNGQCLYWLLFNYLFIRFQ